MALRVHDAQGVPAPGAPAGGGAGSPAPRFETVREAPAEARTEPERALSGPEALLGDEPVLTVAADGLPVPRFVEYVFGELLALNYILDPRVASNRSPVTLHFREPVSPRDLYRAAVGVLASANIEVVANGPVVLIAPKGAGGGVPRFGIGSGPDDLPPGPGPVAQVVPLRYASAVRVMPLLPRVQGVQVEVVRGENALLLRGEREQVAAYLDVVRVLDRPALRGRYAALVTPVFLRVSDLVGRLRDVLRVEGVPVASGPEDAGVFLAPLPETGRVLVLAAEREWLGRVREWVEVLDRAPVGETREYRIYRPRNRRATDLGGSLSALIEGGRVALPAASRENQGERPAGAPPAGRPQAGQDEISADGGFRMVADENQNALIFYATDEEYRGVLRVLEQLDRMPAQVLLEATIAEVTLSDNLSLGLEWNLKFGAGRASHTVGTLGNLGLVAGGLGYSLVADSGDFRLFLNALASQDRVRILSSPRLLVRDGRSAGIRVGTEVPVVTSEATSADVVVEGSSGLVRTVQYRSTGVGLTVTPTVNEQGAVTLELSVEVSEAQTNNLSSISSPIILNRSMQTEVVAFTGQTVVLGGLISRSQSRSRSKVPFLGDLPFLGWLFRTDSRGAKDTELVVALTPRVVATLDDLARSRRDFLEAFRHLSEAGVENGAADKD
ncbi:secretin N-terminal domain-containing protein [Deferrisoma palaeochoriense]